MTPRSPKSPKPRAPSTSSLEKQLSKKGAGRAPSKAMREVLDDTAGVVETWERIGTTLQTADNYIPMTRAHRRALRALARELRSRAQRGARKGK